MYVHEFNIHLSISSLPQIFNFSLRDPGEGTKICRIVIYMSEPKQFFKRHSNHSTKGKEQDTDKIRRVLFYERQKPENKDYV